MPATTTAELITATASGVNPNRLVLTQANGDSPIRVRVMHPGVAEYVQASGHGNAVSGDGGWFLDGKKGREALYLELDGDGRYEIQVREAGVKHAPWLVLTGWQALVGATRLTGNPGKVRVY